MDTAASIIGLSRKTLDDYYGILRKAEALGFNFDYSSNEKMGIIRKFVKNCETKSPKIEILN